MSSLFDDKSVDLLCDEQAKIELGILLGRVHRPSEAAMRLLSAKQHRTGKKQWPKKHNALLESSEDKAEGTAYLRRVQKQHWKRIAVSRIEQETMSSNEEDNGGRKHGAAKSTVLRHPLNGKPDRGQLKDDTKYKIPEEPKSPEANIATKRHWMNASVKQAAIVSPEKEAQFCSRRSLLNKPEQLSTEGKKYE